MVINHSVSLVEQKYRLPLTSVERDQRIGKRRPKRLIADPLLDFEVSKVLCAMKRGDEVVLVDIHYPADIAARTSAVGRVLHLDEADIPRAVRAILTVIAIDCEMECPVERMQVDGEPELVPAVQQEAQLEIIQAMNANILLTPLDRFRFYERARKAYCVIATGETRGWGCLIVKNGCDDLLQVSA